MNLYAIPIFLIAIFVLVLGIFILNKKNKNLPLLILSLYCFTLTIWLFSFGAMYLASDRALALKMARIGFIGVAFIPVFSFHFIVSFLNHNKKLHKFFVYFLYITTIPILFLAKTDLIYKDVKKCFWGYYPQAGDFYIFIVLIFVIFFSWGIILLWQEYKKIKFDNLIKAEQLKYLLFGFGFSIFGVVDYLDKFGLEIYPYGYILIAIFVSSLAYAIIKHHLMDINFAARKILSYFCYSFLMLLIFGFPLYFIIPHNIFLLVCFVLLLIILVSPYIYSLFTKFADDIIFSGDFEYLKNLSKNLYNYKMLYTFEQIADTLVKEIKNIMDIENVSFLAKKTNTNNFYLFKQEGFLDETFTEYELTANLPLILMLTKNKEPILKSDLINKIAEKQLATDFNYLAELNVEIFFPLFVNDQLVGLLLLGKKLKKSIFHEQDIKLLRERVREAERNLEIAYLIEELALKHMQEMEEHKIEYQHHLLETSKRLISVRDITKLCSELIHIISRSVNPKYASIYLYNTKTEVYDLMSNLQEKSDIEKVLLKTNALISYLNDRGEDPLFLKDIEKILAIDNKLKPMLEARNTLEHLGGNIIFPILADELLGFVVIGDKRDSEGNIDYKYSLDELNTIKLIIKNAMQAIQNLILREDNLKDAKLSELIQAKYIPIYLEKAVRLTLSNKGDLGYFMLDLDHFKNINDTYGHTFGDLVLKILAEYLTSDICKRPSDIVCRFGGEEIAIIAPETNFQGAKVFAERMRQHIEDTFTFENIKRKMSSFYTQEQISEFLSEHQTLPKITVSIGFSILSVANSKKGFDIKHISDLVKKLIEFADKSLYTAKKTGRNKVCCDNKSIIIE